VHRALIELALDVTVAALAAGPYAQRLGLQAGFPRICRSLMIIDESVARGRFELIAPLAGDAETSLAS